MNPIHIKQSREGVFTAKAKKHGMTVRQFAGYVLSHPDKFDESTQKQAQFAKNASHWSK